MLELIQDNEKLVHEGGGFDIYYRRIHSGKRADIMKANTKRGIVDTGAAYNAMARYVVTGWRGVNSGGQPVDFDRDLIVRIPPEELDIVMDKAGANIEDIKEGGLGNSETSPDSNPTTEE